MIRITKMQGKYYALPIKSLEEGPSGDRDNIEQFVSEGQPVILVEDIGDLKDIMDLDPAEVIMIEPDEE
jgi:hypothetical protein